ncbi:hypothetical protein [Reyranella sp.]|uniref:hypothetical protein n=1 Tax=Reyranella sp. TaxID=1929291 RepID=UPI003C7CCF94
MASKITVVANMTIEAGTPAKPVTIAPGQSFEIDDEDPENLIGRGIASPVAGAPRVELSPPPPGPIEIPEGWQDLKADELVALARKLGADRDVNRKDEALAFVAEVVAARAANV